MKSRSINRRAFLRGVGGAMMSLPYLDIMAAAPGAKKTPKRMVCIGTSFGFVPQNFFPTETGRNFTLPTLLKPLAKHRDNFTVFSQLDHGNHGVGGHGGVHAYLSGILADRSNGYAEKNISVDQKAAQFVGATTRYPSLQFTTGSDSNNRLSWSNNGVGIPPVSDLRAIYQMLFSQSGSSARKQQHREHGQEMSILDLVKTDASYLNKRVGKEDKERLDQYFTAVREVEKRLTQSSDWIDVDKPEVNYSLPFIVDSLDFVDKVPLYYDLVSLALATDSTRVVTLELSSIGKNLGGFPLTRGYHQLTHHGKVNSYLKELTIIESFHTKQFAKFLDKISDIREADGSSLFDNTMSLLGSGMGNASSHSNRDLPLLLAGGGFKHGQHLKFKKDPARGIATPAANLYVSMLQRFGLEVDKFNLSTGTLTGLELT